MPSIFCAKKKKITHAKTFYKIHLQPPAATFVSEGPAWTEAALSQPWSSPPFPGGNSYFPLALLSQHEKNHIFSGSNSSYRKTSWPVSQWQELPQASPSNHSNPKPLASKALKSSFYQSYFRAPASSAPILSLLHFYRSPTVLSSLVIRSCPPTLLPLTLGACKAEEMEQNGVLTRNLSSILQDV